MEILQIVARLRMNGWQHWWRLQETVKHWYWTQLTTGSTHTRRL